MKHEVLVFSVLFLSICTSNRLYYKQSLAIALSTQLILLFLSSKVYDGRGTLEEGETAESRFIKIQAAYELLIDDEQRRQYDRDHHVNPMKVHIIILYIRLHS